MAIAGELFIMVDREHDRGIALDIYKDKYSLVAGYIDKNGQPVMSWCFRQDYDKAAKKSVPGKSMPIKIEIGTKDEAIQHLMGLLMMLGVDFDIHPEIKDVPF